MPGKDRYSVDTTAPSETTAPDRRRFLRALAAGGAFSALAVAVRTSAAAATDTTAPAATTTTLAAPNAPTANDMPLLKFAFGLELAAVAAYDAVITRIDASSLTLMSDLVPAVRVFRQHHSAYAQALGALIGKSAPAAPNKKLVDATVAPFTSSSAADALKALAALESKASATHVQLLAQLESVTAAKLLASVAPVEARHAVVFELAGGVTDLIPSSGVADLATAIDPSAYPSE
jgi:rubrerythrin